MFMVCLKSMQVESKTGLLENTVCFFTLFVPYLPVVWVLLAPEVLRAVRPGWPTSDGTQKQSHSVDAAPPFGTRRPCPSRVPHH